MSDEETGSDWCVGKAAQVTLRLLARATGNAVLDAVMPFIEQNLGAITNSDYKKQSVALACLAAVLDGPELPRLLPLIHGLTGISFSLI